MTIRKPWSSIRAECAVGAARSAEPAGRMALGRSVEVAVLTWLPSSRTLQVEDDEDRARSPA